jgi:hypothetical protein
MQNKHRYSQSSVRHRRNFPRTLNKFSQQWHNIDVSYHEDKATFICYDDNSPIYGEENANRVFNKKVAEIKLIDIEDIAEAIESMFEYETYKNALLKTTEHFVMEKIMMDGTLKKASWLFSKGKDKTLAKFHLHFEEETGKQFSEKFINKLYTTIKNKIMFKPIYLDEEGQYLTYFSSQFSDFKPGPTYLNTLIQELQTLYKTYTEHRDTFTLTQAQTYAFYLDKRNEGDAFEENSPIAQAWKDQYYFLQRSGLEYSYLKSLDVLKRYIKPFTTEDGKVINFQTDSKLFKRNMKLHFFINQEDEKIDLKRIYVQHQALNEVISLDEQQAIFNTHEMPRFTDLVDCFSPKEDIELDLENSSEHEDDVELPIVMENTFGLSSNELIEMQDRLVEILGCEIEDLKNIEEHVLMEIVDKYKIASSLEELRYVCWFDRGK